MYRIRLTFLISTVLIFSLNVAIADEIDQFTDLDLQLATTWVGENAGDQFGLNVAPAGDVNKDGCSDLIIGAPSYQGKGKAYVISGATNKIIYMWYGQGNGDDFGYNVSGGYDVNNDGYDDLVVGARQYTIKEKGMVIVYSGSDGKILYQWTGQNKKDYFGSCVCLVKDLNKDNHDDILIGAWGYDNQSGRVYAYSGLDGAVLHIWDGPSQKSRFGDCLCYGGDIDKDGQPDVVIGAYIFNNSQGIVYAYSGATNNVIYTWDGESAMDKFGDTISGGWDINGDGYDDVIIGANQYSGNGQFCGKVYVYSGKDGSMLHSWIGRKTHAFFGIGVSGMTDVDSDGCDEVFIGADYHGYPPGSPSGKGEVYLFSGYNGDLIFWGDGENAGDFYGHCVGCARDINCDGACELFVGARDFNKSGIGNCGKVYLYRSREQELCSWPGGISTTTGGKVEYTLNAGKVNANRQYIILGSMSGTSPGKWMNNIFIPLNFDGFTQRTIALSGTTAFPNFNGFLNAEGHGKAYFNVNASLPPTIIGLKANTFWSNKFCL